MAQPSKEPQDGPINELKESIVKTYKTVNPLIESPHHEYSWEELQDMEKVRRDILTWTEEPFWKILSHWNGTCLQILIKDSLLWMVLLLYWGIRVQARLSVPEFASVVATGDIAVIGGFLSFFLVFFVNQNHKRFTSLYGNAMTCKGRIFDVATLGISYLPKEAAMRMNRYLNAAHCAAYVGLSKTYSSAVFFTEINDELKLLTETEMQRMNECDLDKGGACNRELIAWCIRDLHRYHKQGLIDDITAQEFREHILGLRAAVGQMFNAADLPTPFFYVHFTCLLTVLFLPLFSISVAFRAGTGDQVYWTADVVGFLVVLTQTIFVQGLRILGQQMSDPWGDDQIDLSVIHFVIFNWRMSNRVLRAQFPRAEANLEEEERLAQGWIDLGSAWEPSMEQSAEEGKAVDRKPEGTLKILGEDETFRDQDVTEEDTSDDSSQHSS